MAHKKKSRFGQQDRNGSFFVPIFCYFLCILHKTEVKKRAKTKKFRHFQISIAFLDSIVYTLELWGYIPKPFSR